jgi:hypothetical protein
VSGEDDSQGYALSLDREGRTKQLAPHAYVARHSAMEVSRAFAVRHWRNRREDFNWYD